MCMCVKDSRTINHSTQFAHPMMLYIMIYYKLCPGFESMYAVAWYLHLKTATFFLSLKIKEKEKCKQSFKVKEFHFLQLRPALDKKYSGWLSIFSFPLNVRSNQYLRGEKNIPIMSIIKGFGGT